MAADDIVKVFAQWDKDSEYNKRARAWAKGVADEMRSTSPADRLRSSIKYKTRTFGGKRPVQSISFAFNRLGIYLEKGAGRGHGGEKGSRWTGPDGERRQTNPASFGKMGQGARPAKPFLQPAIDRNMDALREIVTDYAGDLIVRQVDGLFRNKK